MSRIQKQGSNLKSARDKAVVLETIFVVVLVYLFIFWGFILVCLPSSADRGACVQMYLLCLAGWSAKVHGTPSDEKVWYRWRWLWYYGEDLVVICWQIWFKDALKCGACTWTHHCLTVAVLSGGEERNGTWWRWRSCFYVSCPQDRQTDPADRTWQDQEDQGCSVSFSQKSLLLMKILFTSI